MPNKVLIYPERMRDLYKILYLGDVVGRPARKYLKAKLGYIKQLYGLDFIIANGENAAAGAGINLRSIRDLQGAGVDVITLGDHVFDRDFVTESKNFVDLSMICVPCNTVTPIVGAQFVKIVKAKISVGVCIVLGRQFMKIPAHCPFKKLDEMLDTYRHTVDIFITEIHAEATSEKVAYGWHADGRADVVVGTHTHVQTADETILPNGTAYITDLGMCGAHKSVIGRDIGAVLDSFINGHKRRLDIAEDDLRLNGCIIEYDRANKHVSNINRFCFQDQIKSL